MNIKYENFKRISENRVKKINDMISKLHNLCNPSFYEYTEDDIENIFREIQFELDKQKDIFKKNSNRKKKNRLV